MLYQIMLAIGLVLFTISMFTLSRSVSFLKKSERTTGRVIKMETVTDNEGTTYKPVFKFKTNDKKDIIYTYPYSSSPAAWAVGDDVAIAYNSNNPDSVRVLTYFGTFGATVILLAISMPLLVVSIGFYLTKNMLA